MIETKVALREPSSSASVKP